MRIVTTDHFSKQLKTLAKKYCNISTNVTQALRMFSKESAQYLGAKLFKVRVRSSDMSKGKSGGFRLIILCVEVDDFIVPVTIYQKSLQENITEHELEYHLARVRSELDIFLKNRQ